MSDTVMALDGCTAWASDSKCDVCAGKRGLIALSINKMQPGWTTLLGVRDLPEGASSMERGGITDLSTHLCIADGTVENNGSPILDLHNFKNRGFRFSIIKS